MVDRRLAGDNGSTHKDNKKMSVSYINMYLEDDKLAYRNLNISHYLPPEATPARREKKTIESDFIGRSKVGVVSDYPALGPKLPRLGDFVC